MRGIMMLAVVFLLGCNQIAELSDEPSTCTSSEECPEGQVCVDSGCVKPPQADEPDPETEREADALGKLGVERDMLESKVKLTSEALEDATETLADAKSDVEKKAAAEKKAEAVVAHTRAAEALERFTTKTAN